MAESDEWNQLLVACVFSLPRDFALLGNHSKKEVEKSWLRGLKSGLGKNRMSSPRTTRELKDAEWKRWGDRQKSFIKHLTIQHEKAKIEGCLRNGMLTLFENRS